MFIKKVANSDAGDADHVGGDNWDALDDYFDAVATGRTAVINSITRYLGSNLRVRNPADTFSYVHIGGAITGTRNVNYPVLTTTDSFFVFDSYPNIFLDQQTINKNQVDLLTLLKPVNTVGSGLDINFDFYNSSSAQENYAEIRGEIVENTAAAVDGRIKLRTRINSTATDIMTVDGTEVTHNKPIKSEVYMDLKNVSDGFVTSPPTGYVRLFLSSTDGHLKYKRSNGDLVVID